MGTCRQIRPLAGGPLRTVIVGYGRAGRELHHVAMNEAATTASAGLHSPDVIAVDPRRPASLPERTHWLADVRELARHPAADMDRTVFHLATPPGSRLPVLRALLDLGARAVVVEKPFAATRSEALAMRAAAASAGAHLVPVAVWPSSTVTHRLSRELGEIGELGVLQRLVMEQSKPRPPRAGDGGVGHRSAFDIEMPHQLLLALHLAGPVSDVLAAQTEPYPGGDPAVARLGGARLVVRHRSGVVSELVSDFTVSHRRRSLTALASHGWARGDYPLSADAREGVFESSRQRSAVALPDRPLTRFLADTYRYLAGDTGTPPAGTDLDLHVHATAVLALAARTAGIDDAPPAPMTTSEAHEEAIA
ncbi:Gfo/Idh/MocA family oxidoreductase [Streptomyces sp. NPDC021093]|uniref:Gfo/Idh/MocA family oxidoreductase n=1 Tax=Streptomyces sp. NPDC021093 TaxID=3365112 RepID=UPI0037A6E198